MPRPIPEHLRHGLEEYVRIGRPTGDFLEAVLSNDLKASFARADATSQAYMHAIVMYIMWEIPAVAQGSPDAYKAWCRKGGLEGIERERQAQEAVSCET